jgi:uncharacterized membrane protein
MEFFVVLAIIILLGPYVVAAWAHARAGRLERAAADWRRRFEALETGSAERDAEIARLRRQIQLLRGETPEEDAAFAEAAAAEPAAPEAAEPIIAAAPPVEEPMPGQPTAPAWRWPSFAKGGLERQFGAVLPVWIGAIAIAFAGFFLVKYSIENQLIGPELRTVFGCILGVALLAGARWVSARPAIAESHRIAQALAGAGIAVLYVSVYAATALYALVPSFIGFLGMAAITTATVILALRHGPPIALLGMVGGFMTPALITSGHPSALLFFCYLYFVFAALMIVIRREGWWFLAFPAVLFAFGWALTWILWGPKSGGDSVWMGLFLLAVAGTIVAATRQRYAKETESIQSWRGLFAWHNRALALNIVSVAGAMGLMALFAFNAKFGIHDWVLFGVLAVGAVALGFFDPRLYGFAPWAAMAINAVMLAAWTPGSERELTIAFAAFGALYVTSGFLLLTEAATPLLWAGLSAASALGYYLIAFFRLTEATAVIAAPRPVDTPISRAPVAPLAEEIKKTAASIPHVWATLAMGLALLFLGAAMWVARRFPPSPVKDRVLAIYALATTAFVALTFFIELDREFLSVAIAAEMAAVAWIATKTEIQSLRPIAGLLGLAFAALLLPQILLLLQLSLFSIFGVEWHVQESIPIVEFPTFQLALPAILFLLAGHLLRRVHDGFLVRSLEFAAITLVALWGFYTTAQLFHPGENVLFAKASFLERGMISNVLFIFGLCCLMIGRVLRRIAFFQSGIALTAVALFRIVYFDLFLKNPLWFGGDVAGPVPVDALALTFIVPIAWLWLTAAEIELQAQAPRLLRLAKGLRAVTLIFAFAWVSLEIRKFYQGATLSGTATSDAEFYSYSVAWLIFALALLFFGTLRGSQIMRYASLAILLLTVTKVFLLDAGNLTGLYRVFSFLGLGLSLLGISYFYGRFVFGGQSGDGSEEKAAAT